MRDRLMLRSSAVLTAVLLGIFVAVVPRPAFAQADKYAAAGATTLIFGPFFTGSTTADLLKEDIQSSNTIDLDLQVTLECGLITDQFGTFSFSDANVTVWIEIDGVVVKVNSVDIQNKLGPSAKWSSATACSRTSISRRRSNLTSIFTPTLSTGSS